MQIVSILETIGMKCLILFSGEKKEKYFKCHLLKILPRKALR